MNELATVSRCESQVMAVIYGNPEPMGLREVMSRVNQRFNKNWKPQTVSTFIARLVEKGYLTGKRSGRNTLYYPILKVEEYQKKMCSELCETCFDGKLNEMRDFLNQLKD